MKDETVGSIVAKDINKARILRDFGIDYGCGGAVILREACNQKGIDVEEVVEALNNVTGFTTNTSLRYDDWSLPFLIDFIINVHHKYVEKAMPELRILADKVADAHADSHPFVLELRDLVYQLGQDLLPHLQKEERILFPAIRAMEGNPDMDLPFGSIQNPIRVMEHDHNEAGNLLHRIYQITDNFTLPENACNTFAVYYNELKAFLEDLMMHIHLENNILFKKAGGF